jgi:lipopolysaccharide export system permease protein
MREVTKYVLWRLVEATLFVTFALAGVVWLSQSLRFVDLIVNRGLSFFTFLHLTLLLLPSFLAILLPVALFCAVVYTYHRLTMDSEIVVLRAAGLSPLALAKPALILAGIVAVICYGVTLYLQPAGFREFKDRQFTIRGDYSHGLLQEGAFNTLGNGLTVYIRARQSNGVVLGILVHDNRDRTAPVTMMAESGFLISTPKGLRLSLVNGNRQEFDAKKRSLGLLYFDRHNIDLTSLIGEQGTRWREPRERYLHELLGPPKTGDDRAFLAELRAEGHQRLVSPLFCFVAVLLGVAALLGGEFSRRGHPGRLFLAATFALMFEGLALGLTQVIVKVPVLTPLLYINIFVWVSAALYFLLRKRRIRRPALAMSGAG